MTQKTENILNEILFWMWVLTFMIAIPTGLLYAWSCYGQTLPYSSPILDLDMIASSQELTKSETGKYRQQDITDTEYYQYSITEYVTPDGSAGYQLFYLDKTSGLFQSYGYGPEAESRTWSIELPQIKATTTADIL